MERLTVHFQHPNTLTDTSTSTTLIGTDENNCSNKDADGANVVPSPHRGYVEFRFQAPHEGSYVLDGLFYCPDALSNGFFVQIDDMNIGASPTPTTWNLGHSRTHLLSERMQMTTSDSVEHSCFTLSQGPHVVRLFVREPGSAVHLLNVSHIPEVVVAAPEKGMGCTSAASPCLWGVHNTVVFSVGNLCRRSQLTADMFRLASDNTSLCDSILFVGEDQVQCSTRALVAAPTADLGADGHVLVDVSVLTSRVQLVFEPLPLVEDSPSLSLGVIIAVATCAISVVAAGIAYVAAKARHANRYAPRKPPLCVLFTDVENS
eukprot:PhM_4_TR18915/c0_g1_i1/m.15501